MVRVKIIIFAVCVCSYINFHFAATDNGGNKPGPKKVVQNEKINLNNIQPPNTIKYFKNALLLYGQIIEWKFYNNEPQPFDELKTLRSLDDNTFPFTINVYLQVDGQVEQRTPLTPFDETVKELLNQFSPLCVKILKKYHDGIKLKLNSYRKRAFYYNALNWLATHTALTKAITEQIKQIFIDPDPSARPQNYIVDFIKETDHQLFFNFADPKLQTIEGWKEPEMNIEAVNFMLTIRNHQSMLSSKLKHDMMCKDIEVYEKILEYAIEEVFKTIMHLTRDQMLYKLAVVSNEIAKQPGSVILFPSVLAPPVEQIDLAPNQSSSIEFFKHLTILFHEAIVWQLGAEVLSELTFRQLKYYPTRDTRLRFCMSKLRFTEIITEMANGIAEKKEAMTSFHSKAYLYRLARWMQRKLQDTWNDAKHKCEDDNGIHKKLDDDFIIRTGAKHVLAEIASEEDTNVILNTNAYTSCNISLNMLKEMGKEDDNAALTMLSVVQRQLTIQAQNLREKMQSKTPNCNALKGLMKRKSSSKSKSESEIIEELNTKKKELTERFGKLENTCRGGNSGTDSIPKYTFCWNLTTYKTLLGHADEEKFESIFLRSKESMIEILKMMKIKEGNEGSAEGEVMNFPDDMKFSGTKTEEGESTTESGCRPDPSN